MLTDFVIENVALPILGLVLLAPIYRLARGPSAADRVIAFDLLTAVLLAIMTMYAWLYRIQHLVDMCVVLALLAFIGTLACAAFLETAARRKLP